MFFESFIIWKEGKIRLSTAENSNFSKRLRGKISKQTIFDKEMRQFQIKNINLNEAIL